ncbi:TonB-dependent receptor [Saprospiraceae bacterium]|nr:TonB-dependent receptor [Saprospiraceae bacterium]MDB4768524.1 TonB-dependent receptor [Saprospiraceae bacterium]MDC3210369.1 TonB-dependent receptor [Saprospiraceae bacterium]
MKKIIVTIALILLKLFIFGQSQSQTIKGTIVDQDTQEPLIGATVTVDGFDDIGTTTEIDGSFRLEDVPVGRRKVSATYVGYQSYSNDNILLNSAKEMELNISLLQSSSELGEVTVLANQNGKRANNEDLIVSAISFSVEDIKSNAASANDPGRMAMGFSGVQPSRDNRSDIVIRGNSGIGLLWRLEGIDIPNPNHFARRGSSGGGITIFSMSMLGNSDFSTGAFSAEYGNAFSGVFDVKLRNGNKDNREYSFKAGILGLDFSTEGPIRKGKSSYLVNYRYSTLGILNSMGIHLVGPRVNNTFQDLSFKLRFASKNNRDILSFWGIGGLSKERQDPIDGIENWKSYTDYLTRDFETNMGAIGMTYTHLFKDDSYLRTNLAVMNQKVLFANDTLTQDFVATNVNDEDYIEGRITLSTSYNKKINPKLTLKTGVYVNNLLYDLYHDKLINEMTVNFLDIKDNSFLIQPYVNFRIRPRVDWLINIGTHAMYFNLNNTYSVEPRLAVRKTFSKNNSLSFAYGLHSRTLPTGSYFTRLTDDQGIVTNPNIDLELIKSHHLVIAYDQLIANRLRLHTEVYFQYLYDVPVSIDENSSYSILNEIDGFATQALVSQGTGRNYGIDISLQQSFDAGFFMLLSTSIFESTYQAINKERFSTSYNSQISGSLLLSKEFTFKNNSVLQTGLKLLFNGGQRLTPLLYEGVNSNNPNEPLLDESKAFTEKVDPYFRPDLRIAYRKDKEKYAWSLSLDVQNAIARRNIDGISRTFDPDLREWVFKTQSSLTPVLSYQIDF